MSVLSAKVAVFTGASRQTGIGRAIARRFAQAGASMRIAALHQPSAEGARVVHAVPEETRALLPLCQNASSH